MSYGFYLYFDSNNSGIETVVVDNLMFYKEIDYSEDYFSGEGYHKTGFDDPTTFYATVSSGYRFAYWIVRYEDDYNNPLEIEADDPDNPSFTYDGSRGDLAAIKPIAEEIPDYWTIADYGTYDLSSGGIRFDVSLKEKEVGRIKIGFPEECEFSFYSSGDYDTYGCISSTGTVFDEDSGGPNVAYFEDDDSGDGNNFKIEETISDVYRYLWFRFLSGDETGTITITIAKKETSWSRVTPYVYTGSTWRSATYPKIYIGGLGWRTATPYMYFPDYKYTETSISPS